MSSVSETGCRVFDTSDAEYTQRRCPALFRSDIATKARLMGAGQANTLDADGNQRIIKIPAALYLD
jgi:hypothetical protein